MARGSASQDLMSLKSDKQEDCVLNVAEGRFEPKMNRLPCLNLPIGPKGQCRECLEQKQRSGLYLADKEIPEVLNSLLSQLRHEILRDKARNRASLKTLSAQRSSILIKELEYF